MLEEEFKVDVRRRAGRVEIACEGDLDVMPAETLREAFESATRGSPAGVVLDLSRVAFLGSAGITALVDIAVACRDQAIDLDLRLSDAARKVLDLVGLWWLGVVSDGVPVHQSLQRALRVYAEESFAGNLTPEVLGD